jgi:hypothetical protein
MKHSRGMIVKWDQTEIKRLQKLVRILQKDVAEYKGMYQDEMMKRREVQDAARAFAESLKALVPELYQGRS